MVRVADGQQGVVAQNGPELRIVYQDRGFERIAAKSERWVLDELNPGPMLRDEAYLIALYADRALRAHERHEPHKWWERPLTIEPPYDEGLVNLIVDYLTARESKAAS
jgi:hypothetical protein